MAEDTTELEKLRELKQAAYNLGRYLRESVAPFDCPLHQKDEWPLKLVVDNDEDAFRVIGYLKDLEQKLKALGCPVVDENGNLTA